MISSIDETKKVLSIGIDLGTTYSSIAYVGLQSLHLYPSPKPIIATDKTGSQIENWHILSSVCVSYQDGNIEWSFGNEAIRKAKEQEDISFLYQGYKLFIGDNFETSIYNIGLPRSNPQIKLDNITPDIVAKKLIEYLRSLAYNPYEGALSGYSIRSVSVSVPALWPEYKKKHVEEIVQAAGFTDVIIRSIEEPIAALYHQIHSAVYLLTGPEKYVLVIDYGGGTCDVAVVKIAKDANYLQKTKTIASVVGRGSHNRGGLDIDRVICKYLINYYNEVVNDIPTNLFLHEAEKLKIEYSNQIRKIYGSNKDNSSILSYILSAPNGKEISVNMTVGEFYNILEDELSSIIDPIKHALCNARVMEGKDIQLNTIQHVFLAGGTILLPLVQHKVKQLLKEADSSAEITEYEPRLAIVYGAALHAFYSDTGQGVGIAITLHDNIWLEGLGGRGILLAEKGTLLPVEKQHTVYTFAFTPLESIKIALFKGDSSWVSHNEELEDKQNKTKVYKMKKPIWVGTRFDIRVKLHESGLLDLQLIRHGHPDEKIMINSEVPTRRITDQIADRANYKINEEVNL